MVNQAFMNDTAFQNANDAAFRTIIENSDSFHKSMAFYCDNQFRKCFVGLND